MGSHQEGCHKLITGNMKTLFVTIALFASITIAQVMVSLIANSEALLIDSIAMGVDTLLFCGNLVAECIQDPASRKRCQIAAAGCSFIGLIAVCIWVFIDIMPTIVAGVPAEPNCTLNITTAMASDNAEVQCCSVRMIHSLFVRVSHFVNVCLGDVGEHGRRC